MIDDNVYFPIPSSSVYDMSGRIMTDVEDTLAEVLEADETTSILSHRALMTAEVYPRVVGVIIFFSSICMIFMARNRLDQLFHRLVIGMTVHLWIFSIFFMWGTAAIPSGLMNAYGNVGTIATCTTQGFFVFVCEASAVLYYVSFSVYSMVGVLNNFEKVKIIWVEKWIHLIVHIYPFGAAIYFLVTNSFNNYGIGFCYAAPSPFYCNNDEDDTQRANCVRGASYETIHGLLIFRVCFNLVFPTIMMIVLYCMVKKRQERIYCIHSKQIFIQSIIYLLPIYFTEAPFLITYVTAYFGYEESMTNIRFGFSAFGMLCLSLFGLGAMLSYTYFSVNRDNSQFTTDSMTNDNKNGNSNNNNNNNNNNNDNNNNNVSTTTDEAMIMNDSPKQPTLDNNFIFNTLEIAEVNPTTTTPTSAGTGAEADSGTIKKKTSSKYSFNIFDGTNANDEYENFIHDGDSDDERVDREQTNHWDACQDYL